MKESEEGNGCYLVASFARNTTQNEASCIWDGTYMVKCRRLKGQHGPLSRSSL